MARADVVARNLLAEHGIDTPPVDPARLVKALGITVVTIPFDGDITGLFIREPGRVVVGVNQNLRLHQQRWAVAHGIGHNRFSRGRTRIVDSYSRVRTNAPESPTDREETEANRFAAALLLPEHLVRTAIRRTPITDARDAVARIANDFDVSDSVAEGRLVQLGILTGPIC